MYRESNDIIKWLDFEIKSIQQCIEKQDHDSLQKINNYLYIREMIFTNKYKDRLKYIDPITPIIEVD